VRGEEGLLVLFEILLISNEHAIEPGEELLGTMIGVQDDGAEEMLRCGKGHGATTKKWTYTP